MLSFFQKVSFQEKMLPTRYSICFGVAITISGILGCSSGGGSNKNIPPIGDNSIDEPAKEDDVVRGEDAIKEEIPKPDRGKDPKTTEVLSGLIENSKWKFIDGMVVSVTGADFYEFRFYSRDIKISDCANPPEDHAIAAFGRLSPGIYKPSDTDRTFVFRPAKNTADGELQIKSVDKGYVNGELKVEFSTEYSVKGSFKIIDCTNPPTPTPEEICLDSLGYEFKNGQCTQIVPKLTKISDYIGSFSANTGVSESESTTNDPLLKFETQVSQTINSSGDTYYSIISKATMRGIGSTPEIVTLSMSARSDDDLRLIYVNDIGGVDEMGLPYVASSKYGISNRPNLHFSLNKNSCPGRSEHFSLVPVNLQTGEFFLYFMNISSDCSGYYYYGPVKKQL